MKIVRRGSFANHGPSSIEFEKTTVEWNDKEKAVVIRSTMVTDFNTPATHDYQVFLPLEILAKVIASISENAIPKDKGDIEVALSGEIKSLVRITAAASGLLKNESGNET